MTIYKRAFLYITRKKGEKSIFILQLFCNGNIYAIKLFIPIGCGRECEKSVETGISLRLDVADAEETFDFHKNADGEIERTLKIPILTQSKLQRDLLEELKDKRSGYLNRRGGKNS